MRVSGVNANQAGLFLNPVEKHYEKRQCHFNDKANDNDTYLKNIAVTSSNLYNYDANIST